MLLVEPHSHFHHLFAFVSTSPRRITNRKPRFAVLPSHEHKAFIPYRVFENNLNAVVRAKALEVHPDHVVLDRSWEGSTQLPFSYLAIATGTRLTPPGTMVSEDKLPSVKYFQEYQNRVIAASSIVIIGGGAVGVQMATDLKELYPSKKVTLVQSRDRVMPKFHPKFNELIMERFAELGVDVITGNRVVVPEGGFPSDGSTFAVKLKDGREIETQLVIPATGQSANNELVRTLPDQINPENGFIRVQPTLQLKDYPNIFAVGDIADTGAHKAVRPGMAQAAAVAKNIRSLIDGNKPTEKYTVSPAGIHLTLGLVSRI